MGLITMLLMLLTNILSHNSRRRRGSDYNGRIAFLFQNSVLLPPSRRLCFCLCWFVCPQDNSKSYRRIRWFFV